LGGSGPTKIMNAPRPLRFVLFTVFLGISPVAMIQATDMVPLDFRFVRIDLANGRILKNAALTGFNRESELIYVMEDRKLKPYPAALFPGFVRDQIDDRLAEYPDTSGKTESTSAARPEAPPDREPESSRPPIGSPEAHAINQEQIESAVSAKAQTAALRHFRYGSRNGSGYSTMTNGDVDLDPPVGIKGWPHRYRVEGTVYFSLYDSVGETFSNRVRGVEVIVEAKSPRHVKVIEVNTDWTPNH